MSGMRSIDLATFSPLLAKLPLKYAALAAIGVTTGCRISEILALKRRDLVDAGKLRETIAFLRLKHGRGVQHRKLSIPTNFRHLIERQLSAEYRRGKTSPTDYVFPGQQGKPLSRFTAYRVFRRYLGAGYGTHWMRKTFSQEIYRYYLAKYRANPLQALETTRRALGHERVENTVQYLGIFEEDLETARNEIFGKIK